MKTCIVCGEERDIHKSVLNQLPMNECGSCGLVWRESFDLPEGHYNQKKVRLDEEKINDRIVNSLDRVHTFRRYVNFHNTCDIGAGEGIFLLALSKEGYKGAFGIEPSNQAVEFSKERGIDLKKGVIEELPKIARKKDINTFTMFHLIEHLENPRKSLRTIFSVMKSGSHLVIETPNFNSYILRKLNYEHDLVYPEHFFYFNEQNLSSLLEDLGFHIIARGKRDFISNSQSLRSLLYKIGIGENKSNFNAIDHSQSCVPKDKKKNTRASKKDAIKKFINLVKRVARIILRKITHLLGREDYMWFIVKRP